MTKPCHDAFIGIHHQPTRPSVAVHCTYACGLKMAAPTATRTTPAPTNAAAARHRRCQISSGRNNSRNSLALAQRPSHAPAAVQAPRRQAHQANVSGTINTKVSSQVTATVVNAADESVNAPHPQNRRHDQPMCSSRAISHSEQARHAALTATNVNSAVRYRKMSQWQEQQLDVRRIEIPEMIGGPGDAVARRRQSVHRQAVSYHPRRVVEDGEVAVRGFGDRQPDHPQVDLRKGHPDHEDQAPDQRADDVAEERDGSGRQDPPERLVGDHGSLLRRREVAATTGDDDAGTAGCEYRPGARRRREWYWWRCS